MKKLNFLYLIIVLFLVNFSFSQKSNKLEETDLLIQRKDSIINSLKTKIDSLKSEPKFLEHSGTISVDSSKESTLFEFLFPSLIALSVALIALFGTLYSTKRQRLSSEKQLEKQIKSSEEILKRQIEVTKSNAELEFRQNVYQIIDKNG